MVQDKQRFDDPATMVLPSYKMPKLAQYSWKRNAGRDACK